MTTPEPPHLLAIQLILLRLDGYIAQFLADFHFLSSMDREFKVAGCLEHEHNSASKAEPAHLLSGGKRLTPQNRRGCRIHGLGVCPRWRGLATQVRSQSLTTENVSRLYLDSSGWKYALDQSLL